MAKCNFVCLWGITVAILLSGCASPFDVPPQAGQTSNRTTNPFDTSVTDSIYRIDDAFRDAHESKIILDSSSASFVRYALFHSPEVEQSYQQWRVASHRVPQIASLPDPRLNIGFFLNEVETRVGPQQSRVGIAQTFPWIGKLRDREDAATKGALSAWYRYHEAQLRVTEQVIVALHELDYLQQSTRVTQDNQSLLESFEEVVRAKYRVGIGSHPQLIHIQLELAQLNDRLIHLQSLRPVYIASLNAVLNREPESEIPADLNLPQRIAVTSAQQLATLANEHNPSLQAINQRIGQARVQTDIARKDGYPDLTIGLDYIVTDEAAESSIAESGDDPVLLSFGINLPLWREKYDAAVSESIANRLTISRELDAHSNKIAALIYRAWFEHTDADRRVRLYEQSLIPKAQESLSASLAAFRTGESEFLDLLDTQRTLLEFSIASLRARADRGKAVAALNRLVGQPVQSHAEGQTPNLPSTNEATP